MLRKLSFWYWFAIITVGLYLVYNPMGFSIYHMWLMDDIYNMLPIKLLLSALVLVFLGLICYGTWKTIGIIGISIISILILLTLFSLQIMFTINLFDIQLWHWIGQFILGFILTVGWQWSKIWKSSTGTVSVENLDNTDNL